MNLSSDSQHPHRFAEKRRLLALRLGQCHGNLRPAERNRNPRKTRAGAEVQQRGDSSRQRSGTGNRFDKMAARIPSSSRIAVRFTRAFQRRRSESNPRSARPNASSGPGRLRQKALSASPLNASLAHAVPPTPNPPRLPDHRRLHKRREDGAGKGALRVRPLGMPLHPRTKCSRESSSTASTTPSAEETALTSRPSPGTSNRLVVAGVHLRVSRIAPRNQPASRDPGAIRTG